MAGPRTASGDVAFALAALVALGGCATVTRAPAPPPFPLELVDSAAFELPAGCEPAKGTVYRTGYVVQPDGRVTDTRTESGDGCVEHALRAWVASFRYRPVSSPLPVVIDWIAVTAARRG